MRASILLAATVLLFSSAVGAPVTVPFVGCPSDGQTDAIPAPEGKPVVVSLPPATAARLAYYKADIDRGVLAPRSWHCFGLYGSSGWVTVVAPPPLKSDMFFGKQAKALIGPVVQVSLSDGESSGRFAVAHLIARYFPTRRAILKRVIAEEFEPASGFRRGPYPADRLIARRDNFVEYLTPPRARGIGTEDTWLAPDDVPIRSIAFLAGLDDAPAGIVVSVRLPKDQDDLAPVILNWAEHTYLEAK